MKEFKQVPGLDPNDIVRIRKFKFGEQLELAKLVRKGKVTIDNITEAENFEDICFKMLEFGVASAPFYVAGVTKQECLFNLPSESAVFLLKQITDHNQTKDLKGLKKKSD